MAGGCCSSLRAEILHLISSFIFVFFTVRVFFFFFHEYSPLSPFLLSASRFSNISLRLFHREVTFEKMCEGISRRREPKPIAAASLARLLITERSRDGLRRGNKSPASIPLYFIRDKYFFPLYRPRPSSERVRASVSFLRDPGLLCLVLIFASKRPRSIVPSSLERDRKSTCNNASRRLSIKTIRSRKSRAATILILWKTSGPCLNKPSRPFFRSLE